MMILLYESIVETGGWFLIVQIRFREEYPKSFSNRMGLERNT